MKFSSHGKIISEAVARAEKVTGKNTSLPVLKCVLLDVKKNKTFIRSTNLDLGIEVEIDVRSEKDGCVAISGDTLSSFLNSVSSEEKIIFEAKEKTLNVSSRKSSVEFTTYPNEDFPTFPKIEKAKKISIQTLDLVNGFKSVWYSASSSSMKPELSSVYVTAQDGELIFAATDSFRLSEKRMRNKKVNDFSPLLIPTKNVHEILRTLEGADPKSDATLLFNENQLLISVGNTNITSRVIDGTFPDYKQIIPKEFVTEAIVLKQDLIDALKISNIFSNKFNQMAFSINPKKKKFSIQTNSPEKGSSLVDVDSALSGEDLDIGFNYKYLTDSFQALHTDSITLHFSGIGKPLVITGVGDTTFTYLVMPMNR